MTGRSTTARDAQCTAHKTPHALAGWLATALLLSACSGLPQRDQTSAAADVPAASQRIASPVALAPQTPAPLAAAQRRGPPLARAAAQQADFAQLTDGDLWHRVRAGFAIPAQHNSRIERQLQMYARYNKHLPRVSRRAAPYLHLVVEELERNRLPLELALLPIVESAYRPFAYSHGRAAGLWQFIPATGRMYGLEQNWWYDGRRDVYASTRAAVAFFKHLSEEYQGDWLLALAAYNAGPGSVNRAIRRNRAAGKPTDYWSLDLPRETMKYVPRLLAIKALISRPDDFGIQLAHIADQPALAEVDIGGQLDLAIAAELSGLDIEQIYRLNPGFNRWATAPDGPHRLLLPPAEAQVLREALAKLPVDQRIVWKRHRIRSGETLSHIAARYGIAVSALREANSLRGSKIRAGRHLLVPGASRKLADYSLSASNRRQAMRSSGGGKKPNGSRRVEHKILPGDTLWDLSRSYGASVRKIATWNGMAPGDALRPGKKLVIWVAASGTDSAAADTADQAQTQRALATQRVRYTVRRGDSLSRIAQRFRIRVADLKRWNKEIRNSRYLQPGQQLNLHLDVRQQSG